MQLSLGDILSILTIVTTVGSVLLGYTTFVQKFGQINNEVKNLGVRVDKLENKVDEILFFLWHKKKRFKKR
jgi:outer membrane murein-binding lipoprotein Lpp